MGQISVSMCVELYSEMCCDAISGFGMTLLCASRQQLCSWNSAVIYKAAQVEVLK